MYEIGRIFLGGVAVFFLLYLLIYATYLFASVTMGAFRLYRENRMFKINNELKHKYYFPISILMPAHNEEITIVDSIKSMMQLDYRLYEIIVIDDGSTDSTAKAVIDGFGLKQVHRPVRKVVPCQKMISIYESIDQPVKITLVCKENGGKGDALNMGINVSQYPYFLSVDADSMLQSDSLERIVRPVLADDKVIAVGGLVRIAQCVKMEKGKVESYELPWDPVLCMQVMEYDRSFLASRILLDSFNGNLIISGAFGLFKKDIAVAVGGYDTNTMGEDMEIVVKMHLFCKNNKIDYDIRYEPNAICWSQAPARMRDLIRQRRRWHIGLFQSMHKYRQLLGKKQYGRLGFISYVYFALFELWSPFVEIFGVLTMVMAWAMGLLNLQFMIRFYVLYALYGAVLTITAFLQRIYSQGVKISFLDGCKACVVCVLENLFFRYLVNFARMSAFVGYGKHRKNWGTIRRQKLS